MMKPIFVAMLTAAVWLLSCGDDREASVAYDPTPYEFSLKYLPDPPVPADNMLTVAKVRLGRMLFYEKKMSRNGTQSCADCHRQQDAFSDSAKYSIGVEKLPGSRQAMATFNLAWHGSGLFWDGRAMTAREQALRPIQDPLEMNETLENVVAKLSAEKMYRDQFTRAFGDDTITPERIGLAIEQFESSMISESSKYDKFKAGEAVLGESEERGRLIFFTEFDPTGRRKGGECFHCHNTFNFTNGEFMNNGLDTEADQKDPGRQAVTGKSGDRAKFKVPTLRNVELTAPYMHDGRFRTLEEVIDHYDAGARHSPTVDVLMQYNLQPGGLGLGPQDKEDLIAFLRTLTDREFVRDARFKSPF